MVGVEGEDARVDARYVRPSSVVLRLSFWILFRRDDAWLANADELRRMLKDDRVKAVSERSLFAQGDVSDKLERPIWSG